MAKSVTARFGADFSGFLAAAQAAEGSLQKLMDAAGVTESRVKSLTASFSGGSIISQATAAAQAIEAIGGPTKLTASEMERVNRITTEALSKMAALGVQAPPEIQKLADATRKVAPAMETAAVATSGLQTALAGLAVYLAPAAILASIIGIAKEAIGLGDELVRVSDRTGISIVALQGLKYVAEQSGNSIDEITQAIGQMQNRLAGNDASAVAAVKTLGLSLSDLKSMSPDEQMYAIAEAAGKIPDPMQRTALAMDIFGRTGAAILPTLRADVKALADEAPRLSDNAARGLDAFGDMIHRIWLTIKNTVGTSLAWVFDYFTQFVDGVQRAMAGVKEALSGDLSGAFKQWGDLASVTMPNVHTATLKASESFGTLATATIDSAQEEFRFKQFTEQTNEAVKKHAEEVRKAADEHDKFAKTIKGLGSIYVPLKAAISDVGESLHDLPSEPILQTAQAAAKASAETEKWKKENVQVVTVMQNVADATKNASTASALFGSTLSKLGPTILSAIQGGGDVGKAIGSMIGNSFGTFFSEKAASATSGFLASKLGGMLGSMMPGLGALGGQLLGVGMSKAMGWIKGLFSDPMKKEIEAANREIDKLKDKMLSHVGNVDELESRYNALGLSIREAFAGQGKQGLEALKAVQDEFNTRLQESKTKVADLQGELKNLQGELDGLIGKANEMGYVFNQQGELIGFNFDRVAQVAKDFGVDLTALGPAFQQAQLTAEAQKVIDAFTLLTMSGADVGGVLVGMKDEINKIVRDSLQFGTVIPANMKPWIEELIRTGQLTDANGQKITDLSQIKFGDPVKSQYEKINDSIQTVLTAMQDLIGQISTLVSAIDAATRPRTLTVTAQYVDPGPPPDFGDPTRGRSGSGGGADQERAVGTMGATGGWFENFGPGRLVRLHGQEAVVRRDQANAFASDMGGGADVAAEVAGLRADMYDALPRAIARAMRDALQLAGAV